MGHSQTDLDLSNSKLKNTNTDLYLLQCMFERKRVFDFYLYFTVYVI